MESRLQPAERLASQCVGGFHTGRVCVRREPPEGGTPNLGRAADKTPAWSPGSSRRCVRQNRRAWNLHRLTIHRRFLPGGKNLITPVVPDDHASVSIRDSAKCKT